MNENKNPKLAKINETVSELLPFLRKSSNQPPISEPFSLENLSDLELKTLEDDPAFMSLLASLQDGITKSKKSSDRTFIVALLSLLVGCLSLAWSVFAYVNA